MSSSYGVQLRLTIFGESHGAAVGMTLEGIPAGEQIDMDQLQTFLRRRSPGLSDLSSGRLEADVPEFLSGIRDGICCGTPISATLRNRDARSDDYKDLNGIPRPGHADHSAHVKYGDAADLAGGGHFSGRLTAPLCIAGGICLQILERKGIRVFSRIAELGGVPDEGELMASTADKPFPVVNDRQGESMCARLRAVKQEGDSLGGVVECAVYGLPAGLGDPIFDGMENRIAALAFGIPAVKGIEFGAGFSAARMLGSENNDAFVLQDGRVVTATNRCGGILGGITTGMPLRFRVAFKPTPSIAKPQMTLDLNTMRQRELRIPGRHDPCVVLRALPAVESAAAIAVYDAFLERGKELV